MKKNYQEQIDSIITDAVTNKTFSLEVIDKIKLLKEDVEALTQANERGQKNHEELQKQHTAQLEKTTKIQRELEEANTKIITLKKEISSWESREADLIHRETKIELVKQQAEMQRDSRQEIKELVSLVFRNPTYVKSTQKMEITPPAQRDQFGNVMYPTTQNITDTERETIE